MNNDKQEPKSNSSLIVSSEQKLNKLTRRLFILSPTVELGLERECTKLDFNQIGDKPIGRGGFGEVWKVVHRETNKTYCIKLIAKREMIEQRLINQLNTELEIMYKIHHPHSVKLVNHFEDEDKVYIVMLFASQGTVFSHIKKNQKLDQATAAELFRETLSIIKYLHSFSPKIIHRDIKPENLLLDENSRVKLCDYGWAFYYSEGEKLKTFCGTPEYVSPEMIKKQGHDYRVDIWALGVLLFEMLVGSTPFIGNSREELFNNITKIKINWPNDFPALAKNLILKILKYSPDERPTLDEISDHPWLKENSPVKEELEYPLLSKKEILLSHIINDLSKQDTSFDQSMMSTEVSVRNGIDFDKHNNNRMEKQFKINDQDLENELNANIERIKNENKALKIQIINTDNLYMTVLKENEQLLHLKKDYEALNTRHSAVLKELDLYKDREKDREALLADNEDKVAQIIVLQREVSNCQLNNISIEALTDRVNSLTTSMEFKDNLLLDLKQQICKLTKSNQEATESITRLNTESSLSNSNSNNTTAIISEPQIDKADMELQLNKLSSQLSEYIKAANHSIETNVSLFKVKDKELALMISHMSKEITTIVSIVKESMVNQINALFDKFSFKSMKTYDTLNWLSKKNKELQEEINSNEKSKEQLDFANEEIKVLKQALEVLVMKEGTDSNRISQIKSSLVEKDNKIKKLENRLSDIKNFIFKNSPNVVLDAFYSQFKNQ